MPGVKYYWGLVLLAVGAVACGSKSDPVFVLACATPAEAPGYDAQVKPILEAQCLHCHSEQAEDRHGAPLSINFDDYVYVEAYGDRIISRAAEGSSMPPEAMRQELGTRSLNHRERCVLATWLYNGMMP